MIKWIKKHTIVAMFIFLSILTAIGTFLFIYGDMQGENYEWMKILGVMIGFVPFICLSFSLLIGVFIVLTDLIGDE